MMEHHPIVEKIVNEGVGSVNLASISKDLRKALFTEAGNILMHKEHHAEAAKAYAAAENHDMLNEYGRWFLQQRKPGIAAYFLLHIEKEDVLENLAQECIAAHHLDAAKAVYQKLGDSIMIEFLDANFGTSQ
ncbi:TPA: hypothetical protein HA251_01470 [Candidatus Woesearchaeota archaeon]|nr:hypothetical protein [Candidatus Woesearchaeota archaeon]